MSYSRAQIYAATLEAIDGTGSARFGDTLLAQTVDAVYGRGWRKILNANRTYRFGARSVTTSSSGTVAYSGLDSGTGDSAERTYKVLGAAQGAIRYYPAEFMDDPLAQTQTPNANRYTFQRQGNSLVFLPVADAQAMTVWVNHLPPQPSQLSASTVTVVWPEDYELIIAYEAGARLMAKGAQETDGLVTLQQMADDLWRDLLADVARFTTDPLELRAPDAPGDWGG